MAEPISTRSATIDDVPGIVALLNAAFAMERDFVDRDRTMVGEIAGILNQGTFLVVDDGEADLA